MYREWDFNLDTPTEDTTLYALYGFDARTFEHISNRKINLRPLTPESVWSDTIGYFIKDLENYLNEMYDGKPGLANVIKQVNSFYGEISPIVENTENSFYTNWNNDENLDNQIILNIPEGEEINYDSKIPNGAKLFNIYGVTENKDKISLVEKIYRLLDLKDPWLMDSNFLQSYADDRGYNVNLNLTNFGITGFDVDETEKEKQVRFVLDNLSYWYRMKTTSDSLRLLMFSFGMIGGSGYYFTDDYSTDFNKWKLSVSSIDDKTNEEVLNLDNIPDDYFPTPHFLIWYDLAKSLSGVTQEDKLKHIGKAIKAVKGVNQVFHGVAVGFTADSHPVIAKTNNVIERNFSLGFSMNVPLDGSNNYDDTSLLYLGI
ncbi:MAG: hypothetical protein ACOCWG_03530 [bacterium]